MATFKTGDVVRAQTGGPNMTVAEQEGPHVACLWFVGDDLKEATFPAASLSLIRTIAETLGKG